VPVQHYRDRYLVAIFRPYVLREVGYVDFIGHEATKASVRNVLQVDRTSRRNYFAFRSVISLLLVLALPFRCEAEDVPIEAIESVQKSVVPVVCMKPTGDGTKAAIIKTLGTGFLINAEGHFLTAAHVVLEMGPICGSGSFWAIYAPTASWQTREAVPTRWFRFDECRYNEVTDVAVCKLVNNPFTDDSVKKYIKPVRFGTFKGHADGSPIAFTGFPLQSIVPITSKGFIAGYYPRERWFGIDKSGWPGASGSPIYNVRGLVIGLLIRRTASDAGGLSFARPIEPILNFLMAEKIPIEK
jgi:S1-C subfamily serine protease